MLTSYQQDILELLELHSFVKKIINSNDFTWEEKQGLIYGPKCAIRVAHLFHGLGIKFDYSDETFNEEKDCIDFFKSFDNKIDIVRSLSDINRSL
jgi:hypothetical protein